MKKIKITYKTIPIIERQGSILGMAYGWKIPEEKLGWDRKANTLLHLLAQLEEKKKLPKNNEDINEAMALSYRNASQAYMSMGGSRDVELLDIDGVINQLI